MYACLIREFNFCKLTCYHAHQRDNRTFKTRRDKGRPRLPRVEVPCSTCETPVSRRPNEVKRYKTAYCSQACRNKGGIQKNEQKLGTTRMTSQGYVDEKAPEGFVKQHRLVMERHLGRGMWRYETVHHKNGNRSDNRLSNLELWSHAQPRGQRVEDKLTWAKELIEQYDPDWVPEKLRVRKKRAA